MLCSLMYWQLSLLYRNMKSLSLSFKLKNPTFLFACFIVVSIDYFSFCEGYHVLSNNSIVTSHKGFYSELLLCNKQSQYMPESSLALVSMQIVLGSSILNKPFAFPFIMLLN